MGCFFLLYLKLKQSYSTLCLNFSVQHGRKLWSSWTQKIHRLFLVLLFTRYSNHGKLFSSFWKAFGQEQIISKILSNFNILGSCNLLCYIQIVHCIYFSKWSNIKWQVCFNFSSVELHVLALLVCWQLRGLTGEKERKKKKKAGEIQLLCLGRTVIVVKST